MTTLRSLRTAIQPRLDAGDSDQEIQAWLHEGAANGDVPFVDFDNWLGPPDNVLTAAEAERAKLQPLIDNGTANPTQQSQWNAITQLKNWAQIGAEVTLSRAETRASLDVLGGGFVYTDAKKQRLYDLSDDMVPRWSVEGVWSASIGEIEQARALS